MILSEFFALTTYLPNQTEVFGQVRDDRDQIRPLAQLRFFNQQSEIAFVAGKKPLTLGQLQTRLSQVSPKTKLACLVDQTGPKPLLGFHQDNLGRLILQ